MVEKTTNVVIRRGAMDELIKHLEFIQANIERMCHNSFQIKGWVVTIVSALLALYANSGNVIYFLIAIVPTVIFWLLDTYYLQQERRFRGVYNDVVKSSSKVKHCKIKRFEMPIHKYKCGEYCYFNSLVSITILPLYGTIIIGLLIAYFMLS